MQGKNTEVENMYESCRNMWERARRTVWEARGNALAYGQGSELGNETGNAMLENMNMNSLPVTPMNLAPALGTGKGGEAKESLEDFIKRIESIAGGNDGAFEFEYVN